MIDDDTCRAEALDATASEPSETERPDAEYAAAASQRARSPSTMEAARIGRFRVLEQIGAGGMGEVFAAFDKELDRRVAIKVLRQATGRPEEHARLQREAQAMARLSHPNVVQVYEVGEHDGQIFIAMEFVKGHTLTHWLALEDRPWQEILGVYEQAGRGLHAAHLAGVVHRDFKPDNVLVGLDGRVRVADFGLAHGAARASRPDVDPATSHIDALAVQLTRRGVLLGTPAYMSPEQYDGAPTDPRTDQFSFCVALYTALYKRRPFTGTNVFDLAAAVHSGVVPEPPADTPVPVWAYRAIATGLALDPGHRHSSMEVLLAELSREPPGSRDPWRWFTLALALAMLLGVLGFTIFGRARIATPEELATVVGLASQVRDAAERSRWVYPDPAKPQDTAILRIVALEALRGPIEARAVLVASSLRRVLADELTELGDQYWTEARPYARDFYAQALVFRPDHPRARERGGLTPGELAELRDRAIHSSFSASELTAIEPLLVLASRDPDDPLELPALPAPGVTRGRGPELAAPPPAPPQGHPPGERATPAAAVSPTRKPPARTATEPTPPVSPGPEPAPVRPAEDPAEDPARAEELVQGAAAARRRGAAQEAARLFHQALAADPRSSAALIGLSDLAFDEGDHGEAIDYAERAVKLAATNAGYRLRLGDAYFKVLRFADARREYEAAAALGHPRAKDRIDKLQSKLGAP